MFVLGNQEQDSQSSFYAFERWKDVPTNCTKSVIDKSQKQTVWTQRLVITSQPKRAIFSQRKRWVVSMGFTIYASIPPTSFFARKLLVHKIMRKKRYQHFITSFINFMHFCGPWHKKWQSNTIKKSFKVTQNSCQYKFYHFLSAVSLDNSTSKMSVKFRLVCYRFSKYVLHKRILTILRSIWVYTASRSRCRISVQT